MRKTVPQKGVPECSYEAEPLKAWDTAAAQQNRTGFACRRLHVLFLAEYAGGAGKPCLKPLWLMAVPYIWKL